MTPAAVARPISIARALFPPWVEVDERDPRDVDAASALMPAEAEALGAVAPKRLREHAAGRLCAHAALGRLGARGAPLLNDADRIPRWPEGVVGTISHTRAWCVAAVARASDTRAIGVDVEHDTPLERRLWSHVLTDAERAVIERAPADERTRLAKLIFSAKECAYKCQYPLSRVFYGFHGMRIDVRVEDGRFDAVFLRDAAPFRRGDRLEGGRFTAAHGVVVTALWLAA